MLLGYFALQAMMILAHEFTHSTTAWLLGVTATPRTVVWGNPVTMQGWNEGVPYDAPFPARGHWPEAAIGGAPLLLHAALIVLLLAALRRIMPPRRPVLFFACYGFLALNLAELVAYLWMRPFIPTGDTGRFNAGLDLSPWWLFVGGSAFLAGALWRFTRSVVPMLASVTTGQPRARTAIVVATAFVLFLWASGLRFLVLYPDPLWRTGLVGIALFAAWLAGVRRIGAARWVPGRAAEPSAAAAPTSP